MKNIELLKELISRAKHQNEGYFDIVSVIASLFNPNDFEQLEQLVNGPIYDGDVISKSARANLFELGLAIRVCHKGLQGYTGANYLSHSIVARRKELKSGPVPA
ncbi:MAG TPA: hypothetical protein EYN67_20810 [Flavobacteriales bacterium]|nr:hypothetical protein [Flavobacteriales bacterium]